MAIKKPDAPGGYIPMVVTSTHLIKAAGKQPVTIFLRALTKDGGVFVTVAEPSTKQGQPFYVNHPFFDIAAFKVRLPEGMPLSAMLPILEEKDLVGTRKLHAGEDVSFVGFPEGEGGPLGMFPLLRTGKVASLDQSFFHLPYFLINADVYPGDSGAPVFLTSRRGRPKLVGMVFQHLRDATQNPMPLALAIDATGIKETIEVLRERGDE